VAGSIGGREKKFRPDPKHAPNVSRTWEKKKVFGVNAREGQTEHSVQGEDRIPVCGRGNVLLHVGKGGGTSRPLAGDRCRVAPHSLERRKCGPNWEKRAFGIEWGGVVMGPIPLLVRKRRGNVLTEGKKCALRGETRSC